MSFEELKKLKNKSSLDNLRSEVEKLSKKDREEDDRFWRPTLDKSKNGSALIRFLPAPPGEDVAFVKLFSHGFKGPGGWYIENSLTTIGRPDPVSEYNTKLWNSGVEANQNIARSQKRRLHFISNILVIKDPACPENEGKVFLFKYGKKILEKIKDAAFPQEDAIEDQVDPFDPFNFWNGANFKLRVRFLDGFPNYDKSEFASPSPVFDDDEKIDELWKKCYSVQEFVSEKNFKTYDELKARLDRVLGSKQARQVETEEEDDVSVEEAADKVFDEEATATASKPKAEEDDDDLSYVQRLANDD
jgi:hypothetical protein